jgi:energy-coupling factor transporter ATP-binding protein EcfA2
VASERGFTAVLVTHDVQEAVVLADRILLIEDGRLAMDLPVGLARPRDAAAPISVLSRNKCWTECWICITIRSGLKFAEADSYAICQPAPTFDCTFRN